MDSEFILKGAGIPIRIGDGEGIFAPIYISRATDADWAEEGAWQG